MVKMNTETMALSLGNSVLNILLEMTMFQSTAQPEEYKLNIL